MTGAYRRDTGGRGRQDSQTQRRLDMEMVGRQNIGGGVNTQRSGMVVTFDVIGTAVRDRNEIPQQAPKTTGDISS